MLIIETFTKAPEWLQVAANKLIAQASDGPDPRVLRPEAVAFFPCDPDTKEGRERSDEIRAMLLGLAGWKTGGRPTCSSAFTDRGSEFTKLIGAPSFMGVQMTGTYRIMVV